MPTNIQQWICTNKNTTYHGEDRTICLVKDCGVGNLEFKTAVFRNVNSGYKVSSYLIFVCSIILPKQLLEEGKKSTICCEKKGICLQSPSSGKLGMPFGKTPASPVSTMLGKQENLQCDATFGSCYLCWGWLQPTSA